MIVDLSVHPLKAVETQKKLSREFFISSHLHKGYHRSARGPLNLSLQSHPCFCYPLAGAFEQDHKKILMDCFLKSLVLFSRYRIHKRGG